MKINEVFSKPRNDKAFLSKRLNELNAELKKLLATDEEFGWDEEQEDHYYKVLALRDRVEKELHTIR